jgi:hypothetical protein
MESVASPLYPFVRDPAYPFLFCTLCRYAVLVSSTTDHLKSVHKNVLASQRKKVRDATSRLSNMLQSKDEFSFPAPDSAPIPHIRPPVEDGHRCNECGWITRSETRRRMHGHSAGELRNDYSLWRAGVRCQQLFAKGPGSVWFEVGPDEARPGTLLDACVSIDDMFSMYSKETACLAR